jgi:hypothetical protein
MRSTIRNTVLAASAILLLAGGTAQASTTPIVKAKVPFAFTVNGRTLPAGSYTVERDDTSRALLIRGTGNTHAGATAITIRDGGRDPAGSKPALTFKQHEGQYRLSGIWESATEGWDVLGS